MKKQKGPDRFENRKQLKQRVKPHKKDERREDKHPKQWIEDQADRQSEGAD